MVVLGASKDSVAAQKKFAEKYSLSFPLLADADAVIIKAYGVSKALGGGAQRKTFLIDSSGRIAKVYDTVNPLTHAARVKEDIAAVK